jgi:hypothetical protein
MKRHCHAVAPAAQQPHVYVASGRRAGPPAVASQVPYLNKINGIRHASHSHSQYTKGMLVGFIILHSQRRAANIAASCLLTAHLVWFHTASHARMMQTHAHGSCVPYTVNAKPTIQGLHALCEGRRCMLAQLTAWHDNSSPGRWPVLHIA